MRFAERTGTNAHAAALARLVQGSLDEPTTDTGGATERAAIELLRSMFRADESRGAAFIRRAALAIIDRRFRDPGLSVARIAAEIGVSERQLSRTFSDTGTGVARVVLERRLDVASDMLRDPSFRRSIADVAQTCGFASHSHFARVFRERFEETPGEARARAQSRTSV